MKHLLIDFENVQPDAAQFNQLDENGHIWLFLGVLQQKTLPLELCEALCRFGKNVHFVRIVRSGKNALDFYLSYYLGRITEQDKAADICILSRDGGYDVLVEHLTHSKLCRSVARYADIQEMNALVSEKKAEAVQEEKGEAAATPVPLYQSTDFINRCAQKVVQTFIQPNAFRAELWHNFYGRLFRLLQEAFEEFAHLELPYKKEVIEQVWTKMANKGLISRENGGSRVCYHLDGDSILKRLSETLAQAKPKSVTAAQNVVRSQARIFCLEVEESTVQDILAYCRKRNILRIENDKITYAPFPQKEAAAPDKAGQNNDAQAVKHAAAFFQKFAKNKPASRERLLNSMQNFLKIDKTQADKMIDALVRQNKISFNHTGKAQYRF
ncbi:PIN domain-containing protein [Neisseria perflava]|uniref:PIN domain-containing protein n=1 Tax=Neisseria perflava TaxID=33053 RepID=UPI00209D41EA|nr:PIN domain-containing protein [Neisseria perflava]MCP1660732.1 hypothetical protein [Neisseria perflava]